FWCGGCQGSLYPFMGHVAHHVGAIQASSLLVHRLLAKLHSLGLLWGFKEDNFCSKTPFLRIKKTLYKTQLVYPIPQTKGPCQPLGKTDLIWGSGKSFPYGGEDFVYLIWTKKHCCLDPAKIAMKGASGGAL
ncbi:MAG: TraU family protein, partial [Simkania negevensis]|nr:TraU family protein [Simkania negevensis]